MKGTMIAYFSNGDKYEHDNINAIRFVNGTLVIDYIDNNGDVQTLKYTRESLKDGNAIAIY